MLSSSRAIVRVPWRSIIHRQSTAWKHGKRSFSAAITLDSPDQSRSSSKNTSRNHSNSLHSLVENGKFEEASQMLSEMRNQGAKPHHHLVYEKAICNILSQPELRPKDQESLVQWLELLPDIKYAECTSLDGIRSNIYKHHSEPQILMSVGRILARKGYKTFVKNNITALSPKTLSFHDYTTLSHELSKASDKYDQENAISNEVFEEASDDYASVMAASAPPPPSILEVVEATLPQILPAPDASDQSVFEEEMDEDYLVEESSGRPINRHTPADLLHQLVENSQFHEAFLLLHELNYLHINVPPSLTYSAAALEALQRPISDDYSFEQRLQLFNTWFSLIPAVHEAQGPNKFEEIQRVLLLSSFTHLDLMMSFCKRMVHKGYVAALHPPLLAVIIRFTPSEEIKHFITSLEGTYITYLKEKEIADSKSQRRRFSARLRNVAVRYLVYSGRIEAALSLIPTPNSGVHLTAYTYEKLFRAITNSNDPTHTSEIPRIQVLLQQASARDGTSETTFKNQEERSMAAELYTSNADVITEESLPQTLRYLKHSLKRAEDNPDPFVIVRFLEEYLSTGRTQAPTLLLKIALNSSYNSTGIFVFAEMLYYRNLGLHHLVIQTFVDHFYISGVPREDVLRHYRENKKLRENAQYSGNEFFNSYNRICDFTPSLLPRSKSWPMKLHCTLVWHSLVALTPNDTELSLLYNKLIFLAQGNDTVQSNSQFSHLNPLLPPPSWRHKVDTAAFTPFMRRLMIAHGPNQGAHIINDMMKLKIEPTVYHFTELAGQYARMNDTRKALMILDRLENISGIFDQLKQQQGNEDEQSNSSPSSSSSSSPSPSSRPNKSIRTVPDPDLILYTSLMRGFIISRNFEGYDFVHNQLQKIRGLLPSNQFTEEQDVILDQLYHDYRELCRKEDKKGTN